METTNKLEYTTSKIFSEDGINYKLNVEIRLSSIGGTKAEYFGITADLYEQTKTNRFAYIAGGRLHTQIGKYFPEFKEFIDLHRSNYNGTPMYAVDDGFYHLKK